MDMILPEVRALLEHELASERSALPVSRQFYVQDGDLPELLWHHTNAEGLLGIVCGQQFRATDVFFFNDLSEVHYALELIEKALPEVLAEFQRGPATQVVDGLVAQVAALRRAPRFPYRMHAVCFCQEPDLLSQWRGYGALGGGFALGFSTEAILDHIQGTDLIVSQVYYDRAKQLTLVRETIKCACQTLIRVAANVDDRKDIKELARQTARFVMSILYQLIVALKSAAFQEEREWRVVNFVPEQSSVEFVVRRGIVVPYVTLSLPMSTLRRVQTGPALEPENAVRSVKELLRAHAEQKGLVDCPH